MAIRIPDINARTDVAVGQNALMNPNIATLPAEARAEATLKSSQSTAKGLQEAAGFMAEYGDKLNRQRQMKELTDNTVEATRWGAERRLAYEADREYESQSQRFKQEFQDKRNEFADRITDQEVRADFMTKFDLMGIGWETDIASGARKGIQDGVIANHNDLRVSYLNRFATARTPAAAAAIKADYDSMVEGMYQSGTLTAVNAQKLKESFKDDGTKIFVSNMIMTNPNQAKKLVHSGQLPLDADSILAFDKRIEERIQHLDYMDKRAKSANQERLIYDTTLKIKNDQVTDADIMKMVDDKQIEPSQGLTLLNSYYSVNKEREEAKAINLDIDSRIAAGMPIDATNTKVSKVVDERYATLSQLTAEAPPDAAMTTKAEFIKQMGYVPKAAVAEIKTGLRADDPVQVAQAADLVARVTEIDPRFKQDLDGKDLAFADTVNVFLANGMTQQQAVGKALQLEKVDDAVRKDRTTTYQKTGDNAIFTLDAAKEDLKDAYDGDDVPDVMTYKYHQLVGNYYAMSGNLEAARKTAQRDMRAETGVSAINDGVTAGENTLGTYVQRYPIESIYSLGRNVSPKETVKLIREDLGQQLQTAGITDKLQNIAIISDARTEREIITGKPSYALIFFDQYGMPNPVRSKDGIVQRYYPDLSVKKEELQKALEKRAKDMFSTDKSELENRLRKEGYGVGLAP